ncbi:type 1 glutamine amidotransferase [Aquabacterium sp.]|uniref:type 1 glutamine amidotransferase n=1 Tax=Aquabacterium sp. TaxID=1872578 RepID=UPI00378318D0
MKPVLVLQHMVDDGPAYLGRWLQQQGLPADVRCHQAGQPFPATLHGYRAMAILGGPMSANDDMPHLRQAEQLVREGVASGIPVIGHCLGGQLMARALGGTVGPSIAPEIGWHDITLHDNATAQTWFGDVRAARVYRWHYEAFSVPAGALALAASPACVHQAFALGPHLALQFHVEQDLAKMKEWLAAAGDGYVRSLRLHPASVQAAQPMLAEAEQSLAAQQALASRIYHYWLASAA